MKIELIAPENLGEKRLLLHIDGHERMIPAQLTFFKNLHYVIFAENIEEYPLENIAWQINQRHLSPHNFYVEIVSLKQVLSEHKSIEMRTYDNLKGELTSSIQGAHTVTAAAVWQGYYLYDENIKICQNDTQFLTCYLLEEKILIKKLDASRK